MKLFRQKIYRAKFGPNGKSAKTDKALWLYPRGFSKVLKSSQINGGKLINEIVPPNLLTGKVWS